MKNIKLFAAISMILMLFVCLYAQSQPCAGGYPECPDIDDKNQGQGRLRR